MRSLASMCAIVIALSCNVAADWYGNDYEDMQPHDGHVTGCNAWNTRLQLRKQMKDVRCMPRDTLVRLVPQVGYVFYPSYALVKRCGGFCTGSTSCMPVRTNLTTVTVRMHGYDTKECYNVFIEEHTKCKCQCNVKEEHCKAHQVYSEDNCACECMNRINCDRSRQMVWDEKMCKCVCAKEEEDCTTGLEWVSSRCRCAKVMEMPYND